MINGTKSERRTKQPTNQLLILMILLALSSIIIITTSPMVSATTELPPIKTGDYYNSGYLSPGIPYCAPGNNEFWRVTYVGEKIEGQDFWHDRKTNGKWQLPLGLSLDLNSMQGQLFGVLHHRQTAHKVPCDKYKPGKRPSHYMIKIKVTNPCNTEGREETYYVDLEEGDNCKEAGTYKMSFDTKWHETNPSVIKVDGWHKEDEFSVSTIIDPLGNIKQVYKDKQGNLVKVVDANGEEWDYEYDANNNLACIKMPGRTGECWDDYKLKINKDNDGFIKYEYDPLGRVIWSYHPDDGVKEYYYDKAGNPVLVVQKSSSDNNAVIRGCYLSGYDVSSRLIWSAFDDQEHDGKNCFDYYKELIDLDGDNTKDTERIIALQPYIYMNDNKDNYRKAVQTTDPDYSPYTFTSFTITNNNRYYYDDEHDNVSSLIRSVNYYDGNDEIKCLDDANDGLSAGASNDYAVGKTCGVETYNDDGSLLSRRRFGYDKKGRMVAEKITLISPKTSEEYDFLITYKYDFAGNLIEKKISEISDKEKEDKLIIEPFWINYDYDTANRLLKIEACDAYGCDNVAHDFKYDASGNILEYKQGDNITISYDYDARDRLLELQADQDVGGGIPRILFNRNYEYDKISNLITLREPTTGREARFNYDPLSRLKKVTNGNNPYYENEWDYDYDALGNRIQMQDNNGISRYEYEQNSNRIISLMKNGETTNYKFDDWGNIISDDKGNYYYDENNMMIRSEVNGITTKYYYDGINHRIFKEGNAKETIYLRDSKGSLIADFIVKNDTVSAGDDQQQTMQEDNDQESNTEEQESTNTISNQKPIRNTATPSSSIFAKNSFTANVIRAADNGNIIAKIISWFLNIIGFKTSGKNIGGLAVATPPTNYDYSTGLRTAYINLGYKQIARINLPVIKEGTTTENEIQSSNEDNQEQPSQEGNQETTNNIESNPAPEGNNNDEEQSPQEGNSEEQETTTTTISTTTESESNTQENTQENKVSNHKRFDFLR